MTFNTRNNVPSTDPRDLYDNAENLDKLVNGGDPFYADRKGVLRQSWAGMENDFDTSQEGRENAFTLSQADKESRFQAFLVSSGYVSKGDYAAGVVLIERNEYVAVDAATTGTTAGLYRPGPGATLPLTLTGTWATDETSLVLLGDDVLRQELAGPDGAVMVGIAPGVTLDALFDDEDLNNGATIVARSYRSIPTIADLRTTVGRYNGDQAFLLGHTQPGYGGGPWRWDASSVAADNNGTIVGSGTGRWVRQAPIPCSYDFGALPGVDATDATNAMLASLSTFATCRINSGLTHDGTVNIVKDGTNIIGDGKYSARVKFLHATKSVSVQAEYCHMEQGGWIGPISSGTGSGHYLFVDDRTTKTADFDFDIENSFVGFCGKLVNAKGRGVKLKQNDIVYVLDGVLEITPPLEADFVAGTADFSQYTTGFRTYEITGNRIHEVYGPLVMNSGNNAANVRGFVVAGNNGDAKAKMWDGYMRDVVFGPNNFNYCGSNVGGTTLFAATGIDNVEIRGNFAGMDAFTTSGGTAFSARSIEYGLICSGPCIGLTVDVSYKNLLREFVLLQNGGTRLDITLNGDRPSLSTSGAVVSLVGATCNGVRVSGTLRNTDPGTQFIPVRRVGAIDVNQHDLSALNISGGNFLRHNFLAAQAAENGSYAYGYVGDGAASKAITTPFPPKSVQFFYGTSAAMGSIDFSLSGLTLTATGFTVSGTLNTSGTVYKFVAS
ncbi:hypothetical protein MST27_04740 [Pseudomonas sp. PS1]|uniref:Uncharacterized protein n=1 Tax=Stutzerimonas marianensis TaxID=2929513 RepID=A0A9X1W102_9GAMM|nr:hypothetical protein [Pseudomonas marianensis]MCJ0972672.1 hypothetical protein [Pseudomonas marianensis]